MKKPIIIILSAGIVVVSLIWLVDQTFLAKDCRQTAKDYGVQQGSSPTEQKTTTKQKTNQKFKPPVYNFPKKSTGTIRREPSSFTKRQRSPNGLSLSNHPRSNSRSSLNTKKECECRSSQSVRKFND